MLIILSCVQFKKPTPNLQPLFSRSLSKIIKTTLALKASTIGTKCSNLFETKIVKILFLQRNEMHPFCKII